MPTLTLISCLGYKDADAAVEWLCRAFGLNEHAVYRNEDGKVVHAELTFGNAMVMLGPDQSGEFGKRFMTLPDGAGGRCTQTIYVIVDDVDGHHARAKAEGAEIVMAPQDQATAGGTTQRAIPRDICGPSAATIPGRRRERAEICTPS